MKQGWQRSSFAQFQRQISSIRDFFDRILFERMQVQIVRFGRLLEQLQPPLPSLNGLPLKTRVGASEDFLDGALRFKNPAQLVLDEAFSIFGGNAKLGCLVSIEAGHPGTIGLSEPDLFQRILCIETNRNKL